MQLQEIEVKAPVRAATHRRNDGHISFGRESLSTAVRVLGEADPLEILKREGGISQTSDYGSGFSVEGSDPCQTAYIVDGIPVFFPYRFGGVFSTFNGMQFGSVDFYRSHYPVGTSSRLGGLISLESLNPMDRKLSLSANVGLIASSVTLATPVGKRFGVTLSGRISYLDQIYGRWLKNRDTSLGYDFRDLNVALFWSPTVRSSLRGSFFVSDDHLDADYEGAGADMKLKWTNIGASVDYSLQSDPFILDVEIHWSRYASRLMLDIPTLDAAAISSISGMGAKASVSFPLSGRMRENFEAGVSFEASACSPQRIEASRNPGNRKTETDGAEYKFWIRQPVSPGKGWRLVPEGCIGIYSSDTYRKWLPEVRIAAEFSFGEERLSLKTGSYAQALHQVGNSDIGLASNYWLTSGSRCPVEQALKVSAGWSHFFRTPRLTLDMELFGARVLNSVALRSSMLDLLEPEYSPYDNLVAADGWNYGFSVELRRDFGQINGTAYVSYVRTERRSSGSEGWWRGDFDPGWRIGVAPSWQIGTHWNVGASMTAASGRVYTPMKTLYLLGGYLMTEYQQRNSARYPFYFRLDLSANYSFLSHSGRFRHLFNLSILNVTAHKNVEIIYYRINPKNGDLNRIRRYSPYRLIPSLSYTFEIL